MVKKEDRRQAAAQFLHQIVFEKSHHEIMKLNGFCRYAIKTYRKLQVISILTSVKAEDSIESIRVLRQGHRLNKVPRWTAYIGLPALCFSITGILAANFDILLSHGFLFSSLFSMFLIGSISQNPKRDKEDETGSNKSNKNNEGSEKSKNRKGPLDDDFLKLLYLQIDEIERIAKVGITVVAYVRVSTPRQAEKGDSIKAQKKELRALAKEKGVARIIWLIDEGKSGRDFDHRKLGTILALAESGMVARLIVSEIDRIGRRSLKLLGFLITLRGYGVVIETPVGVLDVEKIGDLILAVAKAFGAEEPNDLRGYYSLRSKVLRFENHKWNLPIPMGYRKKGRWIQKVSGWDLLIVQIFSLFVIHENYTSVTNKINEAFKDFLEKPLTRQQVRQILENPVYVGRPKFPGEVAEKKFGTIIVVDHSLAYITDNDLFQKVQTIIKNKCEDYAPSKKPVEEFVEAFGLEVLDFLPYVKVHCKHCDAVMRSGGGTDYVCTNPECKRHLNPVGKKEIQKILEWFFDREKCLQVITKFVKKYKWTGKANKLVEALERLLKKNKKTAVKENKESKS